MSLAATAWHEAGHVVAYVGLGFPIESATVVPDHHSVGRTLPLRPKDDVPPLSGMTRALVLQGVVLSCEAGPAAQRLAGFGDDGCDADQRAVDAVCDQVFDLIGVPASRWRHLARAEADRFLRENWLALAHVAIALTAEKTITGQRALELAGHVPVPNMRRLQAAIGEVPA